jgi:hypothetical protein
MSKLQISFITGNAKKLAEVANMLKSVPALDGVLVSRNIDLPELQGACRPLCLFFFNKTKTLFVFCLTYFARAFDLHIYESPIFIRVHTIVVAFVAWSIVITLRAGSEREISEAKVRSAEITTITSLHYNRESHTFSKVLEAVRQVQGPVLIEDTSLR